MAAMNTRATENVIIGPVLGYFLSCTVKQAEGGFSAIGEVAQTEAALRSGAQLPRVEVGPVANANLAQAMLVSQVRWQIENRSGPFARLT
jgi:hypothetical protein